MLNVLTREISNSRFIAYVALLYILAITCSSMIPASSPLFDSAPFVKLALLPLAQRFLLIGAQHRWPDRYRLILLTSSAFYGGIIVTTIRAAFI